MNVNKSTIDRILEQRGAGTIAFPKPRGPSGTGVNIWWRGVVMIRIIGKTMIRIIGRRLLVAGDSVDRERSQPCKTD